MSPELEHSELPADLQQLAEQLSSQAGALARQYPAEMAPAARLTPLPQADSGGRRWLRWILGGGIAASIAAVLATGPKEASAPAADARQAVEAASTVPAVAPRQMAEATSQPMPVYPVGIGLPAAGGGGSLKSAPGLSAPEWEAVLDLTPAEDWEGLELSL